jgi:hypothetical protein
MTLRVKAPVVEGCFTTSNGVLAKTTFGCPVCAHEVVVYNDGDGVWAFCWHRGTKFHKAGSYPTTMNRR